MSKRGMGIFDDANHVDKNDPGMPEYYRQIAKKKTPGQKQREAELTGARRERAAVSGLTLKDYDSPAGTSGSLDMARNQRTADERRASTALDRQNKVANDEPAVEGGDRPSTIRNRAKVKNRGY